MGILRSEDVSGAEDLAGVLALSPVMNFAASLAAGTAAARRPPPVAARKCRRSMPEVTRERFIFGGLRIKNLMQWMETPQNYTLWKPQAGNEIVTKTTGSAATSLHRVPAVLVLSTTTFPLVITHFTLLSTTLMSVSGSPSTATKSARYPGATAPSSFSFPRSAAAFVV